MSRRMLVIGLLNSCVTAATKSDCSRFNSTSRLTTYRVTANPTAIVITMTSVKPYQRSRWRSKVAAFGRSAKHQFPTFHSTERSRASGKRAPAQSAPDSRAFYLADRRTKRLGCKKGM